MPISFLDDDGERPLELDDLDPSDFDIVGPGFGPIVGGDFSAFFPSAVFSPPNLAAEIELESNSFLSPEQVLAIVMQESVRSANTPLADLRLMHLDPIIKLDPTQSDAFDDISNFAAGIGDSLSMGLTSWIRKELRIDHVDYNSKSYVGGEFAEIVVETIITMGSRILRKRAVAYAGDAGRYLLEGSARSAFRRAFGAVGGIVHHWNPIRQGRFPLAFEWAAQGFWNMVHLTQEEHAFEHAWLQVLDKLDVVRAWTSPVRTAGNAIMQHILGRIDDGSASQGLTVQVLPNVTVYVRDFNDPGEVVIPQPSEPALPPTTQP
jgi:hypothetical protein